MPFYHHARLFPEKESPPVSHSLPPEPRLRDLRYEEDVTTPHCLDCNLITGFGFTDIGLARKVVTGRCGRVIDPTNVDVFSSSASYLLISDFCLCLGPATQNLPTRAHSHRDILFPVIAVSYFG